MIVPYKRIPGGGYGPVVSLYLKGRGRWLFFNAYVDTGADFSVFHHSVAEMLDIRLESGMEKIVTVGDGDHMTIYLHDLPVRFANRVMDARIGFTKNLGSGFNLLGRRSFFEKFQFCFNDRSKGLRITHLLRDRHQVESSISQLQL